MTDLPAEVASLPDDAAIAALRDAGGRYARGGVADIAQLSAVVRAFVEMENPGAIAIEQEENAAAKLARSALAVMLQSGEHDARAPKLAAEAIERQRLAAGQAEPVTVLLAGGFFLALAVASKVSYDRNKGWEVQPGFPGLADVLEKAGKLVSAAMSGTGD